MNIFVGNLPFSASEAELQNLFEEHGEVSSCKIITDRETNRSRGFGFIEMPDADAENAINALNGNDFSGRPLRVSQAEEKKPRSPKRFGGRD